MALYEYHCDSCGGTFEKRMPMSDVVQLVPCENCGKQAKKTIGRFAFVGSAEPSIFDEQPPWGNEGAEGGHSHGHDHGHSHGPGGHSHGLEGMDFDDDF